MGGMGALLSTPEEIGAWVGEFRERGGTALQINLWIPDPPPIRNAGRERDVRAVLEQWGPQIAGNAGDSPLPDFAAQCQALMRARPAVASSIMGLFPEAQVREFRESGIAWFATVTTLAEARAAQKAGADAIVAQGFEAGGHRGAFDDRRAEFQAIGLMALLPRLSDHVDLPIIAAGGIADARGIAAALTLGASAVQIGTALLRTPESSTPAAWADALAATEPEETMPTRAFSGRLGRALATPYVRAAQEADAPHPAPYPVQRGLTAAMRKQAAASGDISRMQAWAGQSAWLASSEPSGMFVSRLWAGAQALLP